jgi:hypothetical protein
MTDYSRYASVDIKPPPAPEPAKLMIRNTDGHPGLIITEDDAWELYLLLDKHFGGTDAKDEDSAEGRGHDQDVCRLGCDGG